MTLMENIEKILEQKEIRITPMRQLLLEHFVQENKIFGLAELETVFPKADRITIYRTLKTFEEKGIIHKVENGPAEIKYALCSADCSENSHLDIHPHFHCIRCGEVRCLDEVTIPTLKLQKGYQVKEANMQLKGICPTCS